MACELRSRDCYVGMRVFWIMWVDLKATSRLRHEGEPYPGKYCYSRGLTPEIWSSTVERLPRNGWIMLSHYGKASNVYSCEIDAVRGSYAVISHRITRMTVDGRNRTPLQEAARVLQELAELEEGLEVAVSRFVSRKLEAMDGR